MQDDHLFSFLLIKSDNYELLQQTLNWLFWPHERFPEHYYSPLERKQSRFSRKSTLLQSTRRLKLSFVTATHPTFSDAASPFSPAHFMSSANATILCFLSNRVACLLCQCKFLTVNLRTTGPLFSKLEFSFDNKENYNKRKRVERLHCTYSGNQRARLAQSVEHETLNLRVVGSNPTLGAIILSFN